MHRLWSKVDSPSKTLQASKKALQSPKSGAGKKSVPNRLDSKAGDPALPHRITIWMSLHWVTHYFPALRISTVILHVFLYASSAPAFFHLSLRWYPHIPLAPE